MRLAATSLLSVAMLVAGAQAAVAAPVPEKRIAALCKAYSGKPAFTVGKRVDTLSCPWIRDLVNSGQDTLVERNRAILDRAHTIDRLVDANLRPTDVDCTAEVARKGERVLPCRSAFPSGGVATFDYIAHADGWLDRVEVRYDFKAIYRGAMESAMKRGKVTSYTSAYVDLQAAINLLQARAALRPHDKLLVDGDTVTVIVFVTPLGTAPPPAPPRPIAPSR